MKRRLFEWRKACLILALAGIGSAFISIAADNPQPPPAGGNRPGRGPGPGANFQGPQRGIGLDDAQLQLYREATQKNRDELSKLDEKFRAAQKELVQAAIAEKYDEKIVREKAEAVAKIQVEITTLRAKALSTVAPTLKPEQREQLENSPFGAGMLMGGFGGGGRFGGGRPGPPP